MELETLNLSRICRTCKGISPQMRSIFEGPEIQDHSPPIDEMLMACASVQMTCGDGLPSQICQVCVEQLKNAFVFKRQCEKVDASLREYVKTVEVHEIKEELHGSDFTECHETDDDPLTVPKVETDLDQTVLACRQCSKTFATLKGLRCHVGVHAGITYKCKRCDKAYTRLNHLQSHEKSHITRKVHVCRICSKTLTRIDHLRRHLVTHLKEKPYACKTCNRSFNRVEHWQNHVARCKGDIVHQCDFCSKAFKREDSLELHKSLHHSEQPRFPTIDNLDNIEEHYYEVEQTDNVAFSDHSDVDDCFEPQVEVREGVHEGNITEAVGVSNEDNEGNVSETSRAIEMSKKSDEKVGTDKMYKILKVKVEKDTTAEEEDENEYDPANDVANEAAEDEDASGNSTDPEYLPGSKRPAPPPIGKRRNPKGARRSSKRHVKDEKEQDYPCPACKEVFPTMTQLDRHATQKHEGLKMHKCTVCDKDFNRVTNLKRHLTSHSEVKPFSCDVCSKTFYRRDHLNQHQESHDRLNEFGFDVRQKQTNPSDQPGKQSVAEKVAGEKRFECPLCLRAFATERYRDVHVSGHDGQKDYRCKVCEKTYLNKSTLNEHMKFHSGDSRQHLCPECGQGFVRNSYLVIHMRRHRGEKPFKCKYCGKGFPRTNDLAIHERCHTGEKNHLCTICGKGFARTYSLTVHMRTHTGEKPYQCTYCEAAFAQGNDLKIHMRRHTGERLQCELCTESFLRGHLLIQHKRTVHGLDIVSNVRRVELVQKQEEPDDPPPMETESV